MYDIKIINTDSDDRNTTINTSLSLSYGLMRELQIYKKFLLGDVGGVLNNFTHRQNRNDFDIYSAIQKANDAMEQYLMGREKGEEYFVSSELISMDNSESKVRIKISIITNKSTHVMEV